jgi:hypothetical protein
MRAAGVTGRRRVPTMPSDLPVEQPTKFEFAINMKTSKYSASPCRPRHYFALMR